MSTSAIPIPVEKTGVVLVALLAAAAVLAPRRGGDRIRAGAMLGALVLTPILLVGEIWYSDQFTPVREHPALAIGGGIAGLVVLAALAVLFDRRPALLPLLAVGMLPFRLPIGVGGTTSYLLIPLYVVVAAGGLAFLVPRLRGRRPDEDVGAGRLEWLLVGFVALYATQATYSTDFSMALENVVFFYVPFALLFVLLSRLQWTRRLALGCLGVMVAEAVAFVLLGFYEYGTRHLLLNPKVIDANQFESYFRVNSLFFDPSIYGRFLAMVMIALAAALVWTTRRRIVLATVGGLALLWGGLVLSFSQSSFAALLVGLAALAALRWNWRRTLLIAGVGVAFAAAFVVAFPDSVHLDLGSTKSVNKATSGRYRLMKGGVSLFLDKPAAGYGAGAFQAAYREHADHSERLAVSASHTIPITVAAEQGVIGLAVYLALLAAAFGRLYGGAARDPKRAYLAAAFTALVFHTLLYAAFLEDPVTWALLGAGVAFARVPATRRATVPEEGVEPAGPYAGTAATSRV